MAIESAVSLRRVARTACLVLVVAMSMCAVSVAQLPLQAPVPVMAGSVVPLDHGSTGTWGQIYKVAVAHNGTVLFLDTANSYLYQLPLGATTPTVVVGPTHGSTNSDGSTLEAPALGGYWNSGMALDANDTLYVTDRYGSSVHFYRVPYTPASGTSPGGWFFSAAANWGSTIAGGLNTHDVAIDDQGNLFVSTETSPQIIKIPVNPATGVSGTPVSIITSLKAAVSNVAVDHASNIYFLEDAYSSDRSKIVPGVRMIPAGTSGITGDSTGAQEQALTRIDATGNFNFKGITVDAAGNLYLSSQTDSYGGNANMVLMVPNEGTPLQPNLVWADSVMVSPVPAGFAIAIDQKGNLWIPNGGGNWQPNGSLAISGTQGVVQWAMGSANLGATAIGTPGTAGTVFYSFSSSVTPASIGFSQAGGASSFSAVANPNPDPTVTPAVLPCTAGTTYQPWSSTAVGAVTFCAYYVALNPSLPGSVSGEVQLKDANGNAIAGSNVYLHGVGQGPAISILAPALEVPVAAGLSAPKQVAGDSAGNSYVADSGLGKVMMYPPGSSSAAGTSIGTNLHSPTGVAVDGAGNVYIGDSGDIIQVPFVSGALVAGAQTTIQTGLGNNLNLAVDGAGGVFVADKDNMQVVRIANPTAALTLEDQPVITIGSQFTAPSAIAADGAGNVYVADESSLWELTPNGGQVEITSSLAAPVTGLAVDASGSVYVARSGGLLYIPNQAASGGLNINAATPVANDLPDTPYSVGVDGFGNAFVSHGSAATASLTQLGIGGLLDFGQIVPFVEADQEAQVFNIGNLPLTLSSFATDTFTGSAAADYSIGIGDAPACDPSAPIVAGTFCYLGIALTPFAAGQSSAAVSVLSDAANAPSVTLNLTASVVADNRPATQTAIQIAPTTGSTIVYPGNVTITVTVTGTGTPAGTVTLSVTGQTKQTADLLNGIATFTYSNLNGGRYNVTANYGGSGTDFAVSSKKSSFIVNPAPPVLAVATPVSTPNLVTVSGGATYVIVGGSYSLSASVTSPVGTPTGTVTFKEGSGPADPTQSTSSLDASGNATFNTQNLALGSHTITAVYNGDTNFATVSSTPLVLQIIPPSILISANPAAPSLTAGVAGQVTLTLQPLVGMVSTVNVQCVASSLPPSSECTFDNPKADVGRQTDNTAPTIIVVTISTNVPVNVAAGTPATTGFKVAPIAFAGIFGIGLLGLLAGGKTKSFRNTFRVLWLTLMLSGAAMCVSSCSNSGYTKTPPAPHVATPPGTYQVSIVTLDPSSGHQESLPFTMPVTVH